LNVEFASQTSRGVAGAKMIFSSAPAEGVAEKTTKWRESRCPQLAIRGTAWLWSEGKTFPFLSKKIKLLNFQPEIIIFKAVFLFTKEK